MSPSRSCLSRETSSSTSPRTTVALLQCVLSMVEDTTYLGSPRNRAAHSPGRDAPQRAANHASLRRPSSKASARSASSNSILAHCSRSLPPDLVNQPPGAEPSLPSGSWTTPSSETFVLITIFPMVFLLHRLRLAPGGLSRGDLTQ